MERLVKYEIVILAGIYIPSLFILDLFFHEELIRPYINNSVIRIDNWSIIHLLGNILLSEIYKDYLTVKKLVKLICLWEIVENILLPDLGYLLGIKKLLTYRESLGDIIGDILTVIPGVYIVYNKPVKRD